MYSLLYADWMLLPAAGDPEWDKPWEWSCLSRWCLKKKKNRDQGLFFQWLHSSALYINTIHNIYKGVVYKDGGNLSLSVQISESALTFSLFGEEAISLNFQWNMCSLLIKNMKCVKHWLDACLSSTPAQ